jgi:hypothetical protein
MNQSQIKYAKERLQRAYDDKRNKVGRCYGYTIEHKDELYKAGKYRVAKKPSGSYEIIWDGEEEYKAAKNAEYEAISVEYRKALDEPILGDDAAAFKLIKRYIGE